MLWFGFIGFLTADLVLLRSSEVPYRGSNGPRVKIKKRIIECRYEVDRGRSLNRSDFNIVMDVMRLKCRKVCERFLIEMDCSESLNELTRTEVLNPGRQREKGRGGRKLFKKKKTKKNRQGVIWGLGVFFLLLFK